MLFTLRIILLFIILFSHARSSYSSNDWNTDSDSGLWIHEMAIEESYATKTKPDKEKTVVQTTLNWLMDSLSLSPSEQSDARLEKREGYHMHRLTIDTYVLGFTENSYDVLHILDKESDRELILVMSRQTSKITAINMRENNRGQLNQFSERNFSDLKNKEVYDLITGWMADGQNYEEIKKQLIHLTDNEELTRSYLLEFKEEKKMAKLPDTLFYNASAEEIVDYIWKNFSYENDATLFGQEDYWQSPDELLAQGKGDCEDFALFAATLLKNKGKQVFLVNIYGSKYAHTVVIFRHNSKFNVIDGHKLLKYESETLLELIARINPLWKEGALVAFSEADHRGRLLKIIQRPV